MRIAISAETTCDMTEELLEKYDVKTIPFGVFIGDELHKDGDFTTEELFKIVDETGVLPKTNAVNIEEFTEYFEGLLKEYDAVVHICLSGGITSATKNAFMAAEQFENVYVVDSLSLSTGIALLCIYARTLADQGVDPKTIQEKVQARASAVQASFVIERLDYLYKGGRCSSLQLLGANLLKIRPRIVLKNGKMEMDKKYRGNMESVIQKYGENVFEDFHTPDKSYAFITYTTASEGMLEKARAACANAGIETVYETRAGGTIAAHCGAHTLGILYFNDGVSPV
ncbi:MAG: DegV family protein [Clostridia bacterium]|nr:DegV family protein [Clostridia bacterium]